MTDEQRDNLLLSMYEALNNLDANNIIVDICTPKSVFIDIVMECKNLNIKDIMVEKPFIVEQDFFEKNKTTEDFERPSSIVERKIDTTELEENHRIVLANNFIPERYTKDELFSLFNLPKNISKKFAEAPSPIIKSKVENDQAVLVFSANEYMTYQIYDENDLKSEISNKNGEQKLSLPIEKDRKTLKIKWFYTLYPEIEEEKEIVFVKTKAQPQNNKRWYI